MSSAVAAVNSNDYYDDGDDQSESMSRASNISDNEDLDEEEEVPMKGPAPAHSNENNVLTNYDDDDAVKNESSFLDDDFLSFDHVDNAGSDETAMKNAAAYDSSGMTRKRKRNHHHDYDEKPSSAVAATTAEKPSCTVPSIPWLHSIAEDGIATTNNYHSQSQHARNRGYSNNYNNNYHQPSPPLIKLHNEIVSFTKLMSPTQHELDIRNKMVNRITTLAYNVFGGQDKCMVLPFGSQVTGLSLPGSDIDFVIRFQKKTTTTTKKEDDDDDDRKKKTDEDGGNDCDKKEEEEDLTTSDPLQKFADAVKTEFGIRSDLETTFYDSHTSINRNNDDGEQQHLHEEEEFLSYLEVITQTRVPLVKFTVAPYNLDIDICFDQPHGPESADLMHRFMESMPPLRPLTFCLKYFLASREINKPFTGGIGSYLLQLMIVSFLQHRSRADLNRGYGGSGQHFNLGSLLLDFLELYGLDFNYVTTGISVRYDGYYFPKGQLDKKEYFWQPNRPSAIAVENPLDPTMDVGAGAYRIQMISRVFEHAFKTLLAYVSEPLEQTDSILARILPPTEEMEKRRVWKEKMMMNGNDDGGEAASVRTSTNSRNVSSIGTPYSEKQRETNRSDDKHTFSSSNNKKRRHSGGSSGGGSDYADGKRKNKNNKKREKRYSS